MSKTIVFAPHPDDEVLGCGGTIAKRIKDGGEILVVVMTDGRRCFDKLLEAETILPEKVIATRRRETVNALKALGVSKPNKSVLFLGFEDGELMNFERDAEERVDQVLRQNSRSEIFVTYSRDGHPDHKATNIIIKKALDKIGADIRIYQYSISQSSFSRIVPIVDSYAKWLSHRRVSVDISRFLSLKKEAIREYRSQTALLFAAQKQPVLDQKFIESHLKEKEIFYDLNIQWK